jgi:hypothetical protein
MLRIAEFEPIASASGALHRPRAYADPDAGRWDGYIVFFPLGPGTVVSTPRETTQSTLEGLQRWASTLDAVYLEGALSRALAATPGVTPPATAAELDLAVAELEAAGDAVALHRAADRAGSEAAAELASAEMHEGAAAASRQNAERLIREQQDLEQLANDSERAAAESAAAAHESLAREARAVAADAGSRKTPKPRAPRKRSAPRKKDR